MSGYALLLDELHGGAPPRRSALYTLLEQIARGQAVVVGDGRNRKSMAYVAGMLVHALTFGPGVHVFNYARVGGFQVALSGTGP